MIQCKRVYDPQEASDGYRILVDRLWPRGIKKEALNYDEWCKILAPSTDLRKAFTARRSILPTLASAIARSWKPTAMKASAWPRLPGSSR